MDPHRHLLQDVVGMFLIVHTFDDEGTEAIMYELPQFFCCLDHDGLLGKGVSTLQLCIMRRKYVAHEHLPASARNSPLD